MPSYGWKVRKLLPGVSVCLNVFGSSGKVFHLNLFCALSTVKRLFIVLCLRHELFPARPPKLYFCSKVHRIIVDSALRVAFKKSSSTRKQSVCFCKLLVILFCPKKLTKANVDVETIWAKLGSCTKIGGSNWRKRRRSFRIFWRKFHAIVAPTPKSWAQM